MPTTNVALPAARHRTDRAARAVARLERARSIRDRIAAQESSLPTAILRLDGRPPLPDKSRITRALDAELRAERAAMGEIRRAARCPVDLPAALLLRDGRLAVVLAEDGGSIVVLDRVVACR